MEYSSPSNRVAAFCNEFCNAAFGYCITVCSLYNAAVSAPVQSPLDFFELPRVGESKHEPEYREQFPPRWLSDASLLKSKMDFSPHHRASTSQ
jgi:hypothetical protein